MEKMKSIYCKINTDERLNPSAPFFENESIYTDYDDTESDESDKSNYAQNKTPREESQESCIKYCYNCLDENCKIQTESCMIDAVFSISYILHFVNKFLGYIYDSCTCVKDCTSVCDNMILYPITSNTYQEPKNEIVWISHCWMTDDLVFHEKYYQCFEKDYNLFLIYKEFLDIIINLRANFGELPTYTAVMNEEGKTEFALKSYNNPMLLMKTPDGYFCNITETSSNTEPLNGLIPKKSSTFFITVEYINAATNDCISIDIPSEYYVCGNELFTPIFILRQLKYTGLDIQFGLNYMIRIVDSYFDIVELNSRQYIQIRENDYCVMELED